MPVNAQFVTQVLKNALHWAEEQNYAGYGKFDALNSPILYKLAGKNRYLRGGFTYAVSRSPFNIRPLLGVKKHEHPKALALFARSYFNLYTLSHDNIWLDKGLRLLNRLLDFSLNLHYSGHCWGAGHPRQNTKFYDDGNLPGAVITVEVAEAFLDAYLITGRQGYLDIASSAMLFITNDLVEIENTGELLCYSYIPNSTWKVVNANAKIAAFLARLASLVEDDELASKAWANMHWVLSRQTDDGAWFYADPPRASHVKHDNYHTGFVLSSLLQYMTTSTDERWQDSYIKGLEFYKDKLFLPNGTPKWRANRVYPLDIHGAAQGILNFALAVSRLSSAMEEAQKTFKWVTRTMLSGEGRFYYQKGALWTKRYTLMRWCQAWMSYALSVLLLVKTNLQSEGST
jgi:hypothetical protein